MRSLAVAALLFTAAALGAAPAPSNELLEKGKAAFTINCVPCHGPKGAGDGPAAVALTPKPRNYTTDVFKNGDKVENVFKTVSEGIKDTAMVAYGHLPEQDRWALAYYVLELRAAGKPAEAPVPDAGKPAKPAAKKK